MHARDHACRQAALAIKFVALTADRDRVAAHCEITRHFTRRISLLIEVTSIMETISSNRSGNGSGRRGTSGLAQRLKEDGKARVETGKRSAAEQIHQIADAIDAAGLQLDRDQPTVASYAGRLATGVENFSNRLRDSSIEDLSGDVRGLATRNPLLFLLGGVALGVVLARIMKASDGGRLAVPASDTSGTAPETAAFRGEAVGGDEREVLDAEALADDGVPGEDDEDVDDQEGSSTSRSDR
jgi:hypothetical protein